MDNDFFHCPAGLSADENLMMQRLALHAYHTLGLKDFGRIDAILTEEGPFLLEANVFAGLTCTPKEKPHSYIGFMARAERMDSTDLLREIVETAAKRHDVKGTAGRAGPSY